MLTVKEQPAPAYDESYTYADFLEWDEDVRAEIIYTREIERGPEVIPVSVLDGLEIDTKDIFK